MSKLKIVEWPAEVLETKSEEVKVFDEEIQTIVKDMHETMEASNGIGLAANQVDIAKRIATIYIPWVDPSEDDGEEPEEKRPWHDKRYTFINPKITKRSGKIRWQEGCLSFPEIYDFVDRAAEVWVTAHDEKGNEFEVHADGLFAVCLQHEIDHLDGIVFISRMSRLKSGMIKRKLERRARMKVAQLED